MLILAVFLTLGIYLAIASAEATFVRTLLFERGFTQPAAMFLASLVLVFILLKAFKLLVEAATLRKAWIPEQIALSEPNSQALINLQKSLVTERSLLANRCNRVLAAYRLSGDRQIATEMALDDASFYASASETAYALPRILVWAIPLLGFIGTVIGISQAVNGFSSFLEGAGEIDQIKEGIGVVTSGLATAFDTTFLALLLSVAVMIPLVLVERFETRLLLATDIYINDKLLPRLKGKAKSDLLDKDVLLEIVDEVVRERFPTPETLIEPAREYAHTAAAQLTAAFVAEVGQLQGIGSQLVAQLQAVTEAAAQDRQQFLAVLAKQPELYQKLVLDIQQFANQVKASHQSIALNLTSQGETISQQLEKGA
ncbi:MAG: flagellar motor protein MotA [Chloroflexaceae bacterium]|nr:flagellar motor protein MotA [Chloroflexaceae bacterium]